MTNDKPELFVENLVASYTAARGTFIGYHFYTLKRILFKKKQRNEEFMRMLREDIRFQQDALLELDAAMNLSQIPLSQLKKTIQYLKTHIVLVKHRAGYLDLFIASMTLLITAVVSIAMTEPSFKDFIWVFITGALASVIERHIVLDKLSMYEEVTNLIEARLSEVA